MELTAIITAGGIGKRMGSELPKQFLQLKGEPILQRTIRAFHEFNNDVQLLVTLPNEWLGFWEDLCQENNFEVPHEVLPGGVERYDSIKLALSKAKGKNVLVHDGVRPLISKEVIARVINNVKDNNGVVPVIPLKSSIRKGSFKESHAVDRSMHWEVQTPQGFKLNTLLKAYEQSFTAEITDDASLVEKLGNAIQMVEGEEQNIKVTTPIDLIIADKILES